MQDGSSVSIPYLAIPTAQEHMNHDDIIMLGFIFEVKHEGKRYMKHHGHVMAKSMAMPWAI
jgi:hypothetical protein